MFNNDKLYILRANVLGVEKGPIPVSTIFNNVKKVDAVFKRQSDSATIILSGKKLVFDSYRIFSSFLVKTLYSHVVKPLVDLNEQ